MRRCAVLLVLAFALAACDTTVDDTSGTPTVPLYTVEFLITHWLSDSTNTGEVACRRYGVAVDSFTVIIDRTVVQVYPIEGRNRTPLPDTILSFSTTTLHEVSVSALGDLNAEEVGVLPGPFSVDSLWPQHAVPNDSVYLQVSASSGAEGYLAVVFPPDGSYAPGYAGSFEPGPFGPQIFIPPHAFEDTRTGEQVAGVFEFFLIAWDRAYLSCDTLSFEVPEDVADGELGDGITGAIAFGTVLGPFEYDVWADYTADAVVAYDAALGPAATAWLTLNGATVDSGAVVTFDGVDAPYDQTTQTYWLDALSLSFGQGDLITVSVTTGWPGFATTFDVRLPYAASIQSVSPETLDAAAPVSVVWHPASFTEGYVVQVVSGDANARPYSLWVSDTFATLPASVFSDTSTGGTAFGHYDVSILGFAGGFCNPMNWTGPLPDTLPAGALRSDSLGFSATGAVSAPTVVVVVEQ
jgi:hypothetical protein